LVYITAKGTTFSATAASTTDAVTVQRIDVGATKLASEVSNINAVNSIIVGGPCANAAAATVMGNPADCAEGFEPGVGKVQVFDVGTGNVAMLVAGYSAADTRNAAAVVANYGDYNLKGAAMEVTKVGSTLTVAEPTAEVVEEETTTEE
jgi:Cu/Ag efflux protein CusF